MRWQSGKDTHTHTPRTHTPPCLTSAYLTWLTFQLSIRVRNQRASLQQLMCPAAQLVSQSVSSLATEILRSSGLQFPLFICIRAAHTSAASHLVFNQPLFNYTSNFQFQFKSHQIWLSQLNWLRTRGQIEVKVKLRKCLKIISIKFNFPLSFQCWKTLSQISQGGAKWERINFKIAIKGYLGLWRPKQTDIIPRRIYYYICISIAWLLHHLMLNLDYQHFSTLTQICG